MLLNIPLGVPYYLQQDKSNVYTKIVKLLLGHGADPNARVYLDDGMAVFLLFVIPCYEAYKSHSRTGQRPVKAWYHVTGLLLAHGARSTDRQHGLVFPDREKRTYEKSLVPILERQNTDQLKVLSSRYLGSGVLRIMWAISGAGVAMILGFLVAYFMWRGRDSVVE